MAQIDGHSKALEEASIRQYMSFRKGMTMNRLSALEAFVRVVDMGSFSGAAKLLRIGQPAVSKAIAQLEERTGVTLLRRSTHGLSPTEAGEHFYIHAKRAIEESDQADVAARGTGAALSGRLRVCAAVTFARLHLIPHLGSFMAANPTLSIDVVLDDRNVDLIEVGADVALRMGNLTDSTLTARKICDAPRWLVAAPGYLAKMGEPQTPDDLLQHKIVIYDVLGGGGTWSFKKDGKETSITASGRLRVSAAEGVREAVFNDLGLAVASHWMFAPEIASGQVRVVLPDWLLPRIDLWAIFPTGRQSSAKARAFVSFVKDCLEKEVATQLHKPSDVS
jgi:DNA-binding transcriptional LysR family regulator